MRDWQEESSILAKPQMRLLRDEIGLQPDPQAVAKRVEKLCEVAETKA